MLDFALVREALRERGLILTRLAPHLCRPVPFLYPLQHRLWERAYVGAGIMLYDLMSLGGGHATGVPFHKHLTRRQVMRQVPSLKKDAMVGAIQYYDAQIDDARHTMGLARTAAAYGALVVSRTRVTGFLREGERVVGVVAEDLETGQEVHVRAKQVINATGVWTDDTQEMVGGRGQLTVRASKGMHLVVPKDRIQSATGMIVRTEKSVLFVIPWGRHWIIGTTDTDWELDKAHPAASSRDIQYLLDHVNALLERPLSHGGRRGRLRRAAAAAVGGVGLHVQAVARARRRPPRARPRGRRGRQVHDVPRDGQGRGRRGRPLHAVPGPGVVHRGHPHGRRGRLEGGVELRVRTAERSGLHVARVEHLLRRYGTDVDDVVALVASDPSLGEPLAGAEDHVRAEVVYACSHEGARHLEDVLARRTRISIETFDRGVGAARPAAELMAGVLGWGPDQVDREVENYLARVAAERESQEQPDDETADAVRLGAPEVVPIR